MFIDFAEVGQSHHQPAVGSSVTSCIPPGKIPLRGTLENGGSRAYQPEVPVLPLALSLPSSSGPRPVDDMSASVSITDSKKRGFLRGLFNGKKVRRV